MAKFTNVSGVARFVTYGFPSIRMVEPGGVLEVPDGVAGAYDQPGIWEPVAASAPAAAPASPASPASPAPSAAQPSTPPTAPTSPAAPAPTQGS